MTVTKNISLPDEQAEWVESKHINLSRFVQAKIREEMQEANK